MRASVIFNNNNKVAEVSSSKLSAMKDVKSTRLSVTLLRMKGGDAPSVLGTVHNQSKEYIVGLLIRQQDLV